MIREMLLESVFNPEKDLSPLKVIVDTGNVDYFELRALELIQEARRLVVANSSSSSQNLVMYSEKMVQAVSLLTLARAKRFKEIFNETLKKENNASGVRNTEADS